MRVFVHISVLFALGSFVVAFPAYFLPLMAGLILLAVLAGLVEWLRDRRNGPGSYWSEAGGWGDLGRGLEDRWDYSRRDADELPT